MYSNSLETNMPIFFINEFFLYKFHLNKHVLFQWRRSYSYSMATTNMLIPWVQPFSMDKQTNSFHKFDLFLFHTNNQAHSMKFNVFQLHELDNVIQFHIKEQTHPFHEMEFISHTNKQPLSMYFNVYKQTYPLSKNEKNMPTCTKYIYN